MLTSGYIKNVTYSEIIKRINRTFIPEIDWEYCEYYKYDRMEDSYKIILDSSDKEFINTINALSYGSTVIILPHDIKLNINDKCEKIYKFDKRDSDMEDDDMYIVYPLKKDIKFLEFTSHESLNRLYITSIRHGENMCDLSFDLDRSDYYNKDYYIDSLSDLYSTVMNYYIY